MLEKADCDVTIVGRKLLCVSLTEVFKDIIPSYRVRELTSQEKQQSVTSKIQSVLLCVKMCYFCADEEGYEKAARFRRVTSQKLQIFHRVFAVFCKGCGKYLNLTLFEV